MQSALVFAAILAVASAACPELRCQKPVGYPCQLSWPVDPKTGCEQCPVCVVTKEPTTSTTTTEAPTTTSTTTTTEAAKFADCAGGKKHGEQWTVRACYSSGGVETNVLQCYNGYVVEISSSVKACAAAPRCSKGEELVTVSNSPEWPWCNCPTYSCQAVVTSTTTTEAPSTSSTTVSVVSTSTEAACPELSCRPPAGYPCELDWQKDSKGCYVCPVCRGSKKTTTASVTSTTSSAFTTSSTEAPKTMAPTTTKATKKDKKNKKDKKSRKNKKTTTTAKPAGNHWPEWRCQYGQAPDGKDCECAKNCDVCQYYEWEMQEGCLWCAADYYFDSNKGKCKAVNKDVKKKSKKDKKKAKKEKETTTTTTTTTKEKKSKKSKKEKKTTTKASKKVKAKGSVQI